MEKTEIRELLKELKNTVAPDTCEYWDVRIEKVSKANISYDEFELFASTVKPSLGAFIRVFNNGMWFFSSTTDLTALKSRIEDLSKQTKEMGVAETKIKIKPYNEVAGSYKFVNCESIRLDKVSMKEKQKVIESYFDTLKSFDKLKNVKVHYADEYKVKFYQSSTDINFELDFNQCGLVSAYSIIDGDNRFDDRTNFHGSSLDGLKNRHQEMKQEIEEGHKFLSAKAIEAGSYPIVLDGDMTGLFAHESFGHKSEADFMLGDEDAIKNWEIGQRVGNECLSIVDWGAEEGTSGYCPIDDEGFPTQKTYLIKDGILQGRLHSQFTAKTFNERPTGNGRAMNFEFEPIVRMTNTYVEPGNQTIDEMISGVKLGVYATAASHGSGLSTFTMAPRRSYMIRDGKIAEPVRVSVISGNVMDTLNGIEGCSKKFELKNSAFGGCGKNDQWPLPVGTGGSWILVNKMVVS